jgi:hypothetical protein
LNEAGSPVVERPESYPSLQISGISNLPDTALKTIESIVLRMQLC